MKRHEYRLIKIPPTDKSLVRVTCNSKLVLREVAYFLGACFADEKALEKPRDNANSCDCDEYGEPCYQDFIFVKHQDDETVAAGVASFALGSDRIQCAKDSLKHVWIHPDYRRTGLLKEAWPKFKRRFGSFAVEPPYFEEMECFLRKYAEHQEFERFGGEEYLSFARA
jgi:hypothetical protein